MSKRIPIIEEVPRLDTQVVEGDAIRVRKHREQRIETLDPTLLGEEVEVRRVAVWREVDGPVPIRQDGDTTVISVHEQVAVLATRWVVVEEIHLQRQLRERRSPQALALARDRVEVERIPPPPAPGETPPRAPPRHHEKELPMATTLVAMFDDAAQAEQAKRELALAGIQEDRVQVTRSGEGAGSASSASSTQDKPDHRGFFARLFGLDQPDEHSGNYAEAVRRGSSILTVQVEDDSQVTRISQLLERAGAEDIDRRVEAWKQQGYTGYDASAPQPSTARAGDDRQTLKVVEENLQVGKRQVEDGGVRVHRRLMEKPVSEQVTLREERAVVERHPVDRPATDADLQGLSGTGDETIELRERHEEAVVGKTARVVEEVEIGKQARERTETVEDTIRRHDVEIEPLEGNRTMPPNPGTTRSGQDAPRNP